jgi:hypothetical protein
MKIKEPRIPNKENITPLQKEQPVELVRILKAKESGDKICLRVAMSREFYNELYEFLKQKGYVSLGREREGMSLLLEFGLSEESREELERNKNEMWKESSHYAAISFQTSEYYAKNSAITMGLRLHLQENKLLKQKLKEKGLGDYASEDEWDKWNDSFISELYRRYVFGK